MRTIGHRKPPNLPRGTVRAQCDYCGARYHSSDLVVDGSGLLACPDDATGMDKVTAARSDADAVLNRRDRTGQYMPSNSRDRIVI